MAKLHGVLRDDAGAPLAGATISVTMDGDLKGQDTTGPEGEYAIVRLPEGRGYTLEIWIGDEDHGAGPVDIGASVVEHDIALVTTLPGTTTTVPLGGTTMQDPTGTTTTDTTTTGTTTTGTTTTGTTTTGTTTTGTTTASTTTTLAPGQQTDFDKLLGTVALIDLHPPVNIDEAREFRRLYTVANYVAPRTTPQGGDPAGVPAAIQALDSALSSDVTDGPTLIDKNKLVSSPEGELIQSVLSRIAEDHNNEAKLLREARAQFDLGTAAADSPNTEFKVLFREFVDLCADALMAFDPQDANVINNPLITPERFEEVDDFMRRAKRSLIRVVESMSRAGRPGTSPLTIKWAGIVNDSIRVLTKVGREHIASDDPDLKHPWSVVATLVGLGRGELDGYFVHAKEAAALAGAAVDVYAALQANGELSKDDSVHLQQVFHGASPFYVPSFGKTVSEKLRENASLIQENWIPEWS